mmetsp:Transcript_13097/g.19109  ORF Transcript_13097/g.19109 Transcript_13097/m.19109 type:complete len:103 (-) Transcript_13097:314-622(-)
MVAFSIILKFSAAVLLLFEFISKTSRTLALIFIFFCLGGHYLVDFSVFASPSLAEKVPSPSSYVSSSPQLLPFYSGKYFSFHSIHFGRWLASTADTTVHQYQ